MTLPADQHQELKNLLRNNQWDEAETLWLDIAQQDSDHPEVLLLLVKEFADAGRADLTAELAGLIAPNFKAAGRHHEWLYALRLQAQAMPRDAALRAELLAAYREIYASDPRLPAILAAAKFETSATPLPDAINRTETLLALAVGAPCQHKSWGFGRVKTFDATLQRIVVAFPHNPDHAMQLPYAAESLVPVSVDHIEVRKVSDLPGTQQLAASDPAALVRCVLLSFHRAATLAQIETALAGSVIPVADWKKWWDNARKLIKRDPHFEWPAKKTDRLVLRAAPVSQQDRLLQAFRTARGLCQQTEVARQFLKAVDEFEDPELPLQEFHDALADAIAKHPVDKQADRLEAALVLDDLLTHQRAATAPGDSLTAPLLANIKNLPAVLDDLSTIAHHRVVAELKRTQPDRLLANINRFSGKTLDDIADLLAQISDRLVQHVRNQTASYDLLNWLAQTVTDERAPAWLIAIPRPALLAAILNAIELAPNRTVSKKLRDLLLLKETVLTDLLMEATTDTVREFSRQILVHTGFEELDRRLLMARMVKEFPVVQELLVTRSIKEQPLIVSWASFHRRKAELDDIIQKKMPQNSKEIAQARSYGDLRENFEFKAAKDAQKLLMRRRAELEVLLIRAVGTDFDNVSTATVQIGTSVTITDVATGVPQTYHILGAWDSDTARNIISYPAALAQTVFNKPVGEIVEAASETGPVKYRIDRIEKVPPEILQAL